MTADRVPTSVRSTATDVSDHGAFAPSRRRAIYQQRSAQGHSQDSGGREQRRIAGRRMGKSTPPRPKKYESTAVATGRISICFARPSDAFRSTIRGGLSATTQDSTYRLTSLRRLGVGSWELEVDVGVSVDPRQLFGSCGSWKMGVDACSFITLLNSPIGRLPAPRRSRGDIASAVACHDPSPQG